MEVWLSVSTDYDSYNLFYCNFYCHWIYNWFNEKIDNLDSKVEYTSEIKVSNDIVDEFFHDCLSITLDPKEYLEHNKYILYPLLQYTYRDVDDIQNMAGLIIKKIYENKTDILGEAEFYLGVEL